MNKKNSKKNHDGVSWKFVIGILIFFVGSIAVVIFLHVNYDLSVDIIAIIIPVILAIFGWFFTTEYQRTENKKDRNLQLQLDHENKKHEIELEHKRRMSEIQLQSYEQRKNVYKQFTDLLNQVSQGLKGGKGISEQELTKLMMDINFEFLLIGSDEVCKLWIDARKLAAMPRNEKRTIFMLILYARIFLAFRRDLGNENTILNEMDVLRSYITDIDKHEEKIREFLPIESIDDIEIVEGKT